MAFEDSGPGPTAPAVLVEAVASGRVLVVTINRPRALNTSNATVADGVGAALERARSDPRVRIVVLTAAGGRAFCAGVDIKAAVRGEPLYATDHPEWGFAGFTRHDIGKPTIAAVNGLALGGGAELILAADMVVAARSASIGLPEVTLGLFAAAGGAVRLPRQIPVKVAMEMLLTGEPVSATRAYEVGLVNEVVEDEQVLPTALRLAERIAANAPLAVAATRTVVRRLVDGDAAEEQAAWRQSAQEHQAVRASHDATEGLRAFAEKRRPAWQLR